MFTAATHPLIRKLSVIIRLTAEEQTAILDMPMQMAELGADQDIVRSGDSPSRSCILLDGFCRTYKILGNGRRQVLAFHIAGDFVDLQSLYLPTLDFSIGTVSRCTVGFVRHKALDELCWTHKRLGVALWRNTLVDAAVFREWMSSIGQREAYGRIAHLLCEIVTRNQAIGLAMDFTCRFPITQTEMADALGLTPVHVNRVLQELRADGLIVLKQKTLTVLDWSGLQAAGDFEPSYLHMGDTRDED